MKKSLPGLAAAAMLAFGAGPALADEYGPPAAIYGPADWSGFYIGAHAGAGWADIDWNRFPGSPTDVDASGFLGGGLAGFNFQMDNIVIGVEGDVSFGDVDKSGVFPSSVAPATLETDFSATIRARLGWAFDNTLLFATAGIGFIDVDVNDTGTAAPTTDSRSHTGFVLGAGVESKLGNIFGMGEGLVGRLEYLYGDYGNENYTLGGTPDPLKLETHTVRAALIWQFPVGLLP